MLLVFSDAKLFIISQLAKKFASFLQNARIELFNGIVSTVGFTKRIFTCFLAHIKGEH
ncbi:hypothetical protein HMPREF9303_0114 [Prevotella denticola CRIS 18C-A]|uniref:Uncharacterized protein n=1 Tax=Prevotella denticola CRIS 18C-A TaxID=944557 RepID=F0HB47_9BACT|nr:hypothetical protein HMPREF9303_0114 [Prevotella denticola CRIS 18C-A]